MPRRPEGPAAILTLALLLAGCGHLRDRRPPEHESTKLLRTGSSKKFTARQSADVQAALGRSLENSNDFAAAKGAYLEALRNDPRRAETHARLAMILDQEGDAKGADKHFSEAARQAPRDPEILCDRGYYLYLHRRWSDAEESLRLALKADSRHARSHNNLGLVLARRGDADGALAEFGRAGCDEADARANLALVLAQEGRMEEARASYALALAAKPRSEVAREGLRAANLALAGGTPTLAGPSLAGVPRADPAVRRASAESPLPPLPGR